MKTAKTTIAVMTAVAVLGTLIALGPGTALAGTTRPASRAAGGPGITGLVIYAARTQVLSANGTSFWTVVCPAGTLPVGGGTIIQDPRLENVTQAGFRANAATRKFDGYQASVHVSGLQAGGKVRFAVQVACIRSTTYLVYVVHGQIILANGTTSWGVACPAGTLPVGGGAIIQDPRLENVTQTGFHANAATRKFDGYQASVRVSGLQAGSAVGFIVQVACMPTATPVVYRIRTQVFPARGRSVPGKACHAGICPVGGATTPGTRIEKVTQAGFYASAATGKFDGYQASVSLSARPGSGKVLFTVQVVCMAVQTPPVYGPQAQLFPALRNTAWSVTCPAGTIPVAGGAMAANRSIGVRPVLVSG